MPRPLPYAIHALLWLNIGLQLCDGLATYYGLSLGLHEGNPLIQATLAVWGVGWGLVLWKGWACLLLVCVYAARVSLNIVPALAFTATYYAVFSFVPWLSVLSGRLVGTY